MGVPGCGGADFQVSAGVLTRSLRSGAYLLLIEVLNTHTVNTCSVFSGFVGLRNKQVFRSNPTGCTSAAGQIYVQSHLLHRQLMDVNLQLAVRQSQDDTGGGAGLGPDLSRGLQVNDT